MTEHDVLCSFPDNTSATDAEIAGKFAENNASVQVATHLTSLCRAGYITVDIYRGARIGMLTQTGLDRRAELLEQRTKTHAATAR